MWRILDFLGIDDTLQLCEYGYSVMAEDNTNYFEPIEITRDEMKERIAEMEKATNNSSNMY